MWESRALGKRHRDRIKSMLLQVRLKLKSSINSCTVYKYRVLTDCKRVQWQGLFSSVVEHWSRKPGVMGSIPIGGIFVMLRKLCCGWQGSNLHGQSHLDFKSNALTTWPQLPCSQDQEAEYVEMWGIEPWAFHIQSKYSTNMLCMRGFKSILGNFLC